MPDPPPARVLIADDDPYMRRALSQMIATLSRHQVVATAGDGREAVELCASHRPDVVLMDVEMPGLDGLQASALIAARWPGLPVIMISAQATPDVIARSHAAGAVHLLSKMAPMDRILAALDRALERQAVIPL